MSSTHTLLLRVRCILNKADQPKKEGSLEEMSGLYFWNFSTYLSISAAQLQKHADETFKN